MKVALGQFVISTEWQRNAETCQTLMAAAASAGAALLVLPEAAMAQNAADPDAVLSFAQPLEGPFLRALLAASRGQSLTTLVGMHTPANDGRVYNTQVAIRDGELLCHYHKLHLYDAWNIKESTHVTPGTQLPPVLEVGEFKVGLMTCYDLRFPDLARTLVMEGADVLVAPSAWVAGPLKERHWEMLLAVRALENTCYMVGVSACGGRNIGNSMVVDPLGVAVARAAEGPALIYAQLESDRIKNAREVLPVLKNSRFAKPQLREM